jgi:riboflavin kinase / FMN adenylyltransferase
MEVLRGLDGRSSGPTVATIGVFDGLHKGHKVLHDRVLAEATRVGAKSAIVTFDPHPLEVVAPDHAPCTLTTIAQRLALFETEGVGVTLILQFTKELAKLTAEEFIRGVLVDALHVRKVIVAEDFRFGNDRAGDTATLARMGERLGFECETIELVKIDGNKVSSSDIRKAVAAGDVERAADLLGHPFRLEGVVVEGDKRGRAIGFPTANVQPDPRTCLPALGVYAGWWVSGGRRLPGVINVGVRPTFKSDDPPVVEIHLFDLDEDLYGRRGEVEFTKHLRPEERFASVDELVAQIRSDAGQARGVLGA